MINQVWYIPQWNKLNSVCFTTDSIIYLLLPEGLIIIIFFWKVFNNVSQGPGVCHYIEVTLTNQNSFSILSSTCSFLSL